MTGVRAENIIGSLAQEARRVSIRDVAKLAGVSTATVSHVINGTHFVSAPLEERVVSAMQQLNYHPNTLARSLRTKATHSIGLIVSDIELPFFATLVRGVQDAGAERGRTVILCNTDEAADSELVVRESAGHPL